MQRKKILEHSAVINHIKFLFSLLKSFLCVYASNLKHSIGYAQYFQASEISRKLASLRESFTNLKYSLWHCFAFAHNFICNEKSKWTRQTGRAKPYAQSLALLSLKFPFQIDEFQQYLHKTSFLFTSTEDSCWLEGNVQFLLLKSKLETNPLFGDNVFSLVMILSSCWECRRLQVLETSFEKDCSSVHTVTFPPMRNFEFCCMQTHKSISFSQP